MSQPAFHFINLAALLGGGFYFLKKPVRNFFFQRSQSVGDRRNSVRAAFSNAEAEKENYQSKLMNADHERKDIIKQAQNEGEEEAKRLMAEAARRAARIAEVARFRAVAEVRRKNRKLYTEMAEGSLKEAERKIENSLTDNSDVALSRDFLKRLRQKEES